jgi:hypothetical protein
MDIETFAARVRVGEGDVPVQVVFLDLDLGGARLAVP